MLKPRAFQRQITARGLSGLVPGKLSLTKFVILVTAQGHTSRNACATTGYKMPAASASAPGLEVKKRKSQPPVRFVFRASKN